MWGRKEWQVVLLFLFFQERGANLFNSGMNIFRKIMDIQHFYSSIMPFSPGLTDVFVSNHSLK
jgi:hypothetical protein